LNVDATRKLPVHSYREALLQSWKLHSTGHGKSMNIGKQNLIF